MPIAYAENPWQGTTNQVSGGAKHPETWKRDILFGVLLPCWTRNRLWATLTLSLLWHPKIQIHFAAHRLSCFRSTTVCISNRIPVLPTLSSCPRCVVWGTCNVDITCNLLIRSQLHLSALSEHPRQSSSTTNSAELQKARQWRQPQVASSTALWWMIKPTWNWHNTWK